MRRILKEVKPLSQDQRLNQLLNSLNFQGKPRIGQPERQEVDSRLAFVRNIFQALGNNSSSCQDSMPRAQAQGRAKVEMNCSSASNSAEQPTLPTLPPKLIQTLLIFILKGAMTDVQETKKEEEPDFESDSRSSHNNTADRQPNPQMVQVEPFSGEATTTIRMEVGDDLPSRPALISAHLLDRNHAITSTNPLLPDDFLHVKKFWNLDSKHPCSDLDTQTGADMSEEPTSPSSPRARGEEEDSRQVTDLDSIFCESIQELLEETPNEIIFSHTHPEQSRAYRRRVYSSSNQPNEPNGISSQPSSGIEVDSDLSPEPRCSSSALNASESPESGFSSLAQFRMLNTQLGRQNQVDHPMTPSEWQHEPDCSEIDHPQAPSGHRMATKMSRHSRHISKPASRTFSRLAEHQARSFAYSRALYCRRQWMQQYNQQSASEEVCREQASSGEASDVSMSEEEDIQASGSASLVQIGGKTSSEEHPAGADDDSSLEAEEQPSYKPYSIEERHNRILRFFERKRQNFKGKRYTYECRRQVAEKRLRIKGRFVTKQQAFEILGLKGSCEPTATNEQLQKLLEQHFRINQSNGSPSQGHLAQIMHLQLSHQTGMSMLPHPGSSACVHSLAEGGEQSIKVRNLEALFEGASVGENSLCPQKSQKDVLEELKALAARSHESYSSQQQSILLLLQKLKGQKSLNELETWIEPLFLIEQEAHLEHQHS